MNRQQIDIDRTTGRHAVILCHPDAHSFNRAVADTYCGAVMEHGHEAVLRDLYGMEFDPVLKADERPTRADFELKPDVARELAILRNCDVLVLIYPIWFGTPPAMLKGYVERVLGSGVDPKSVELRRPTSFMAGKRLLSFTTSATSASWLSQQGEWLSLRYLFDHYLTRAFSMLPDQHIHFPGVVPGMEARWAEQHLYQVRQQARETCSIITAERHQARALAQAEERVQPHA